MSQSLANILLHLIFSTKDRSPWLEKDIREKTHAFLAGVVRQCDCEAYRVGGVRAILKKYGMDYDERYVWD